VSHLWEFYPGICLTTEEKAQKNLSQGKKNLSQVKKNLSQSRKTSVRVAVQFKSIIYEGVDKTSIQIGKTVWYKTDQNRPTGLIIVHYVDLNLLVKIPYIIHYITNIILSWNSYLDFVSKSNVCSAFTITVDTVHG